MDTAKNDDPPAIKRQRTYRSPKRSSACSPVTPHSASVKDGVTSARTSNTMPDDLHNNDTCVTAQSMDDEENKEFQRYVHRFVSERFRLGATVHSVLDEFKIPHCEWKDGSDVVQIISRWLTSDGDDSPGMLTSRSNQRDEGSCRGVAIKPFSARSLAYLQYIKTKSMLESPWLPHTSNLRVILNVVVDVADVPHRWGLRSHVVDQLKAGAVDAAVEVQTRLQRLYPEHFDADPQMLTGYGYVNREANKPYFVTMLLYITDGWPRNYDAETLFLDLDGDVGVLVRPAPFRTVLMDQDITHRVSVPSRAAGRQPRYSLVWKLLFIPKTSAVNSSNTGIRCDGRNGNDTVADVNSEGAHPCSHDTLASQVTSSPTMNTTAPTVAVGDSSTTTEDSSVSSKHAPLIRDNDPHTDSSLQRNVATRVEHCSIARPEWGPPARLVPNVTCYTNTAPICLHSAPPAVAQSV